MSDCSRANIVIFCKYLLFFYCSMHLYMSESYFVCAVSLTHSLRLCKSHLARHKYIINRHLHCIPLKLESFSRKTTCILVTMISTVSVRMAVTSLPASLAMIGSARNRQDVRLTGRSPIQASHRSRPVMQEIDRFRSLAGKLVYLYCITRYAPWYRISNRYRSIPWA